MRAFAVVLLLSSAAAHADDELRIRSGDVDLHAIAVGDRAAPETVIVLHGGPGLSLDYLLPLRRLADGGRRRLIFYEQRGAGGSARPASGDYSLAAHVADLEAVRRATAGKGAVHLLAHSWGTVIAIAYAIEHPRAAASLVLVGMGAAADVDDRRSFGAAFGARRAQLVRQGLMTRKRPPPRGDDCMASFSASLPAHFADPRHPAAWRLPGTYRCGVAGATLRAVAGWDFRRDVAWLAPRVLLVSGDADANLAGARETAQRMPEDRARLGELAACGHFPWLECPEPFFAMVERFLGG